jgi:hypothetical protein
MKPSSALAVTHSLHRTAAASRPFGPRMPHISRRSFVVWKQVAAAGCAVTPAGVELPAWLALGGYEVGRLHRRQMCEQRVLRHP